MEAFISGLIFITGIGAVLFVGLIVVSLILTKECPTCRGSGRVYKGVDYICPTCKGTRTISKKVKA